jgi:molybdopterin molybdotransferase
VGTEDHTPRVAAELGELAVHGVALRPAGPLGVAFLANGRCEPTGETSARDQMPTSHRPAHTGRSPLFLIPGNPVACLCAYDLFAGLVVRRLGGRSWELPYRKVTLPLVGAIASAAGRVDYVRVKVAGAAVVPLATGGAGNLSTAVVADGFVLVPRDLESLEPGRTVDVWLYDV